MGMADIRAAFEAVAGKRMRLQHAALRYQDKGQVLDLTGWHADDTPFVYSSAPFHVDPNERAKEIAADLIRAAEALSDRPNIRESHVMAENGSVPEQKTAIAPAAAKPAADIDAHSKMMALVDMFDSGLKGLEQEIDELMQAFPDVLKEAEQNTGALRSHVERIKKGTQAMKDFNNRMSNTMPKL